MMFANYFMKSLPSLQILERSALNFILFWGSDISNLPKCLKSKRIDAPHGQSTDITVTAFSYVVGRK